MEVLVSDVLAGGQVLVAVGDTIWRGDWRGSTPPRLGPTDVEVDVLGDLRWSQTGSLTATPEGENVVVGLVEDSDATGAVTMRVSGGIVLVDVPDDAPLPRPGDRLRLDQVSLAFHPTGVRRSE